MEAREKERKSRVCGVGKGSEQKGIHRPTALQLQQPSICCVDDGGMHACSTAPAALVTQQRLSCHPTTPRDPTIPCHPMTPRDPTTSEKHAITSTIHFILCIHI